MGVPSVDPNPQVALLDFSIPSHIHIQKMISFLKSACAVNGKSDYEITCTDSERGFA